jgi:hypothetical protein
MIQAALGPRAADSITAAEIVGCASMALRLDDNVRDPIP